MYTPVAAVDAPDWVLVGSVAVFVGTVLHLVRVLRASRTLGVSIDRSAYRLEILAWGCLVLGAFLCAVGAWAICVDVPPTRV